MLRFISSEYDRNAAVQYAHLWAHKRNPKYYNFDGIGGDCTNFASQILFAGTGVMNYTPTFGWYFDNLNRRTPAWTSVVSLYNFLTGNKEAGPYGREVGMAKLRPGDLVQLSFDGDSFQHTPVVVSVGRHPDVGNILVAAHTDDSDNRPLSSYIFENIRFIHIDGYRHTNTHER